MKILIYRRGSEPGGLDFLLWLTVMEDVMTVIKLYDLNDT